MSIFNRIKVKKPKRSTFNLSHNSKLTLEFGYLVPTYWNYFEPNTTFKASSIIQCRTMPMLAPIMHEVNIYSYWFVVPVRLLMDKDDYEKFITGGQDGQQEVAYPKYDIYSGDLPYGTALLDYLDCPVQQFIWQDSQGIVPQMRFDAMPFRAYAMIWNEFFRDQNTTEPIEIPMFIGTRPSDELTDSDIDILSLKSRCWTKDYFTSALPWAQRGGDMNVPFTVMSELVMDGTSPSHIRAYDDANAGQYGNAMMNFEQDVSAQGYVRGTLDSEEDDPVQVDVTPHTKVNSGIIGTINEFRQAYALQRWKERNALGGSRYIEQINSHFGVWADDYRLQRPAYLGGSRTPLQISEVLQTSESSTSSQQGAMSGRGYSVDSQGHVKCFLKEHSIIMNLISIVPKPSYFQGLPRKLDIRDRFDFPWPLLSHLGEQEVRRGELFYTGNDDRDDRAFGYQSRYAQYKYEPNRIHGDFADSLLFWTLARKFSSQPHLNREFLTCSASKDGLDRIFPVLTEPDKYADVYNHFWAQINFNIRAKRPLPYFGTPNL